MTIALLIIIALLLFRLVFVTTAIQHTIVDAANLIILNLKGKGK